MGNSGIRKLFFPGDLCETKYNTIFEIPLMDLERNEVSLEKFKESPCLIVNIASLNPESPKFLQELKEIEGKFNGKLTILGFPSNQFGNEPKNFEEIKKIYREDFKLNFPIFGKVSFFLKLILNFGKRWKSMEGIRMTYTNFLKGTQFFIITHFCQQVP